MLPGYISYYMGIKSSLGNAVPHGVACALGLIAVFSAIGAMASILGSVIDPYIPLLELVAAIATILFGVTLLVEIRLPTFLVPLKAPKRRGVIGIFLYGVIYGLATLGCSAPIFFAVLFWAVASGPVNGMITFLIYAAGMGLPLILTTILVSVAKERMLKKMMSILPRLQKISGVILIIIGIYLIYFYYSFFYAV